MADRLAGKVAIVTGAGAGFGEGIARRFAAEGAAVIVNDIHEGEGEDVAEAIRADGGRARFVAGDMSRDADMARLVDSAKDAFDGLDVMVCNAGVAQRSGRMEEVDEATYDRIFEVNMKQMFWAAKHCVPLFKAQKGGCFINTSSTAAVSPRPYVAWYCAAKGAVSTLTQAMALELAPFGIRANAILPVAGDTRMLAEFMGGAVTDERRRAVLATIPLGRLSQPLDIAKAAVFLASDDAAFITGVNLPVDGGRTV